MVTQTTCMYRSRNEIVSKAVHCQQRSHFSDIAVIVNKGSLGKSRTGGWFCSNDVDICPMNFIVHEREGDSGKITSTTTTANNDVGIFNADFGQLFFSFLSNNCLVQHYVI